MCGALVVWRTKQEEPTSHFCNSWACRFVPSQS